MEEHDPRQEARRAQLLAAAEAVRVWIHAQRGREVRALAGIEPTEAARVRGSLETAGIDETAEVADVVDTVDDAHGRRGRLVGPVVFKWAALAGVAVVAAGVVIGGERVWRSAHEGWPEQAAVPEKPAHEAPAVPPPAPTQTPVDGKTGSLAVDSNPEGAHILIDGNDRGVAPATITELAVGSHALLLKSDHGSVRRTVTIAANQTAQVSESIFGGWLHLSTPLEVDVSEGARGFQLDAKNQMLLDPGVHEIQFANRALGYREVREVEIKPGWTTSITLAPKSTLTVTSTEPAEVLIDGVHAGDTPLTDAAIAIGTRDIKVRSAAGAERTFTIPVTASPARLDVDFSKK